MPYTSSGSWLQTVAMTCGKLLCFRLLIHSFFTALRIFKLVVFWLFFFCLIFVWFFVPGFFVVVVLQLGENSVCSSARIISVSG